MKKLISLGFTALVFSSSFYLLHPDIVEASRKERKVEGATPIAILGDSDSHNYHDKYHIDERGGEFSGATINWPEMWGLLRGDEVDLGRYGVWGTRYHLARIRHWLGLKGRTPKKLDFEYNYAISGLRCRSLLLDWPYQAKWLSRQLESDHEYWRKGIVIIRLGTNDLANRKELDLWSESGLDDFARKTVVACIDMINEAISMMRRANADIKIAVVGMARNYNIMPLYAHINRVEQIEGVEQVLSFFDSLLYQTTQQYERVAFIEENIWFNKVFGDKLKGTLKLEATLAGGIILKNAVGDHPENLVLADGHAGTYHNQLWLESVIEQMNDQLGTHFSPPSLAEVKGLVDSHL